MAVTPVFAHLDEALAGVARAGVVHVGAHRGQEVPLYRAAGFQRIVLVEPNPEHRPHLEALREVEVHPVACGEAGAAVLHRTRWSEQSSLQAPNTLDVVDTITVDVVSLSELQAGCNVAVLDVQGAELAALRTADLSRLDAVIVEMDTSDRYEDAGSPDEIRDLFISAGWSLGSTWPHRWDFLTEEVWVR